MTLFLKTQFGYLEQIPVFDKDKKVEDVLKEAYKKVYELDKQIKQLENEMQSLGGKELESVLRKYDNLLKQYESLDGYNIDVNYKKICNGLEFKEDFLNKEFNLLSGGEKTTVLLGKTLLENNKLLLLDEPTNHLDIRMVVWLEEYIKEYNGTILIISHDRYFLDKVANTIIEIEDGEAKTYKGNYTKFKELKEEEIERQYELYRTQQKKIKAMKESIKRLKDFGTACHGDKNPFFKRAFSMEKRLEKMEKFDKVKEKKPMIINAQVEQRSANRVIIVEKACKSFGEKVILNKSNMLINYLDKIALIGENGAGKTTFIKMLLGEEKIDSGKIVLGNNVDVAYLEQNVKFENTDLTILEYFMESFEISEEDSRNYLAKFLFFGEEVFKKISKLSGGEKSRLRLCKMLYKPNNLLILDEPTNHLDIDAREQIEEMLLQYKGTIFFISHDRYFINKIANKIVELENSVFTTYEGSYDYYAQKKFVENKKIENAKKEKMQSKELSENKKQLLEKKKVKNLSNEIKKVENKINKVELEIEKTDDEMKEFENDYIKIQELFEKKKELEKERDQLMEEWMMLQ